MTNIDTGSRPQAGFHGGFSSHAQLEDTVCDFCEQPVPNERLKEIRERFNRWKYEQIARDREQLAHDRHQLESNAKAAGIKEGEAAARAKLAEVEASHQQQFKILLEDNARLKEGMQTAIDQQVNQRVAAEQANFMVERAMHQQELAKVRAEVEKLKRIGDQRTSQRLGEMGELEIFNALKAARPQDRIIRVPKGQEGADVDQFFVENRKEFGSALWEIKNASKFQKPYTTKLLDNQLKAGRDWGILVLGPTAFPPGVAPVAQPYEGVLLCPSGHVVPLQETLRRFTWKLHQMKVTSEDGDARRARLFARFATDKGRALLQRVNDGYSKLRQLDSKLQSDVNRHINQSAAVYEAQQRCLGDVFDAIDRLIDDDDDNEGL